MGDFVKLLLDSIGYLWPIRLCHQWERGGYYVVGRWWREVGPGWYPVIPFFMDVKTTSIAKAIVGTGRQDITLLDGSMLSFQASVWAQVEDVYPAMNEVDDPHTEVQKLLESYLADELAEADVDRLKGSSARKRRTLLRNLEAGLQEEAVKFGVKTWDLRFTSFVLNVRTHRLLIDQAQQMLW